MTRRERMERRVELRQEWAAKASVRSQRAFDGVHAIADGIPLGQPILVGHHSEKRARRDQDRIHSGMSRGCAEHRLFEHHQSKASGIAIALERSIFDDDPDAIERLEAKIAELTAHCERLTAANKAWRKGGHEQVEREFSKALADAAANSMAPGYSWVKSPFSLTSDRREILRCKARIANIRRKLASQQAAEVAGGVTVEGGSWVSVTFADKPERSVLDALRSAGYRWGNGRWVGERSKLPEEVTELQARAQELRKADAGECLCGPLQDGYECVPCEQERLAGEPSDSEARS